MEVLFIILWCMFGVVNVFIANHRKIHLGLAFFLGFFLGIIGTIVVLFMPSTQLEEKQPNSEYEKVYLCTNCGAQVFPEQKYCSNCGSPSPKIVEGVISSLDQIYRLKQENKITEEEYSSIKKQLLEKIITNKENTNV